MEKTKKPQSKLAFQEEEYKSVNEVSLQYRQRRNALKNQVVNLISQAYDAIMSKIYNTN